MIDLKKEVFEQYARQKNLRSTRQRDIILDTFLAAGHHTSAEELYIRIREQHPSIGQATVYRTLKLFVDAGIAREMIIHDGQMRYEQQLAGEHHDHLICSRCDRIVEFENDAIEELQKQIADTYGFIMTHHTMDLYGICPTCRAESRSNERTPKSSEMNR